MKKKTYYDVEKMNKMLEGISAGKYFKLKEGKNRFRILPRLDGSGTFFLPITQHFGYSDGERGRAYPCLKAMKGKDCPGCLFANALGEMDDKAAVKKAREMSARTSFLMNVLDRSSGKIKVLSANGKMLRGIKSILDDEDYGPDVLDPEEGNDWAVTREGTGFQTRYSDPRVSPKPTSINYPNWEDDVIDLNGEVEFVSYNEFAEAIKDNFPDLVKECGLKFKTQDEEEEEKEDVDSENGEEESTPKKRGRGRPKREVEDEEAEEDSGKGHRKRAVEEDQDDEDDEDFDVDDDEEEITDEPPAKRRKRK